MDARKFRAKYLWALATSPLTLYPVAGGLTALAGLTAFDVRAPVAWLAGVCGVLFGTGVFFQRLVSGCERIAHQAREEVEREAFQDRESALDRLDGALTADGDPRTERTLRDLRALSAAFNESMAVRRAFPAGAMLGLQTVVEQTFDQCVASLQATLDLFSSAGRAATPEVKRIILDKRDALVRQVQESVRGLSQTLAAIEELAAGKAEAAGLSRLSRQLNEQLEIARSVDARLKALGLDESLPEDLAGQKGT